MRFDFKPPAERQLALEAGRLMKATDDQIRQFVDASVTDLVSAKKLLAAMLIMLRDRGTR